MEIVLDLLRAHLDPTTSEVSAEVMPLINKHEELKSFNKGKQVPQFAAMMREEAKTKGPAALALSMPFDELSVLRDNLPYLCATLNVAKIHLFTDASPGPQPTVQGSAVPGKPQPHFFFDADLAGAPGAIGPADGAGSAAPAAAGGKKPTCFEYLERHEVAVALNAAVNQLGVEQPADPYAWLAAHLAKVGKERATKK